MHTTPLRPFPESVPLVLPFLPFYDDVFILVNNALSGYIVKLTFHRLVARPAQDLSQAFDITLANLEQHQRDIK